VSTAAFIAGDWGTTHLRLWLCDAQGTVLDQKSGAGVAQCVGTDWPGLLAQLIASWTAHGPLPVYLCGMVGSNIGWTPVPYVPCPVVTASLALHMKSPQENVWIVPGLCCKNHNDAPDVIRGEETQILGALQLQPTLKNDRQLLCLPGTHTKWVLMEQGQIEQFTTAVSGEMFAIIQQHSVLIRSDAAVSANEPAFNQALLHAGQKRGSLQQWLFECRSRTLLDQPPLDNAPAYLSGLLIGDDVNHIISGFAGSVPPVTIVGTASLCSLYAAALQLHDVEVQQIDGALVSQAGLTAFYWHHRNFRSP
jgi:2-dehydro-3-deoxygalactonokinase